MAQHKKYHTEEERKAAQAARAAEWRKNNPDKLKEIQENRLKKLGFTRQSEYTKQTTSYQSRLKKNQPEKFKELFDSKPENTKQHPVFTDYHIDTEGNAWKFSTKRQHWIKIKTQTSKCGYNIISLYIGKTRYLRLHHLVVIEAWIGPKPSDKHECDHIDMNKSNNKISNLRWLTISDNKKRRVMSKRKK